MLVVFKILSALLFMLYTFISSQLILGEKKKINKNQEKGWGDGSANKVLPLKT